MTVWYRTVATKLTNIERQDCCKPIPSAEEVPVVYSLVYPPQGCLQTKEGICPDKYNLRWLKLFKSAIVESTADGCRLKLEVRAFASIAPVEVPDDILVAPNSDSYNLEIANERGRAVVEILTSNKNIKFKDCVAILADNKPSPKKEYGVASDVIYRTRKHYEVIYWPWKSYDHMMHFKPVYDGVLGGERRHATELFNRVVQIIVTSDSCWRGEWMRLTGDGRRLWRAAQ